MFFASSKTKSLEALQEQWAGRWEAALEAWSRFTKLHPPRWCLSKADEKKEGLTDSFAMIRLMDHAVVISLRQVQAQKLEGFADEILAHEIGHHVYTPADLRDNARLLTRIKAGLPTREAYAPMIANLYTDLLINDRLQRSAELDMAGVYRTLGVKNGGPVWNLYMLIYEVLWNLPAGTLSPENPNSRLRTDATLGARLIRVYSKDWIEGAGRFAALFLPHLLAETKNGKTWFLAPWLDTPKAGSGSEVPDGLTEIEDGELDGVLHPAEDPDLNGLGDLPQEDEDEDRDEKTPARSNRALIGGKKNQYRDPKEYTDLMKSLGVEVSEEELVIRYYKERARPHLIRYPTRKAPESTDPLPEGLEPWEAGFPLHQLDWVETMIRSPYIIPGATTVQRTFGVSPGTQPERLPLDLFLGVDCSGSMGNPRYSLSYPVLAGTIITLSALKTGARVKVTLSGEPGEHSSTDGFIRTEKEILKTLTGYLGTGYAFGVLRLKDTFLDGEKPKRPVHILIVTDNDIFYMLREIRNGWQIAKQALEIAGGGGTFVLNIPGSSAGEDIERLRADGWNVHRVSTWEELVAFARAFAKAKYEDSQQS